MNNTNSIYIHSQTALPKEYSNLLKEGGSVFVRILKDVGNGKYIASFAGGRYHIFSKEKLFPGSSFMAKVSLANGQLNLFRISNQPQNLQTENKATVQNSNVLSAQVEQLLLSLGLPADSISKLILQTLVALGAKFNLNKINKARNVAMQFAGQEDEAAEIAMILLDKGIEPSIENIQDCLTGFGFSSEVEENSLKQNNFEKSENLFQLEKKIKKYFLDLTTSKIVENEKSDNKKIEKINVSNIFDNDENAQTLSPGFLTIFNHIIFSNEESNNRTKNQFDKIHWIVVPFDFSFKKEEQLYRGNGVFRIALDLSKKNVKKTVINFNLDGKIWTFLVSFKDEEIEKIKFSYFPYERNNSEKIKKALKNFFSEVEIELVPHNKLLGFANDDVMLSLVEGYV